MTYHFMYNVPADNHLTNYSFAQVQVLATLNSDNSICIDLPNHNAAHALCVKDWFAAVKDMQALARIEFDKVTSLPLENKLTA